MIKNISRLLPLILLATIVTWVGCKKEAALTTPPEQGHFLNITSGSYFITAPGVTYKIPLGLTTVSNVDRTINIAITSPTGAVNGTHYTVNKTSFVIPAGKVIDTLVVTGNYAQYTTARKDTLVITIQGTDKGGVAGSDYNNVFKLFMRGPCSDLEIATDYASFLNGSFKTLETAFNSNGSVAYANSGPYTTTVSLVSQSGTTAVVRVTKIYGITGWDANFTLDWTTPGTPKVTTTSQKLGNGAVLGLSAYDIYVEPPSLTQNLPSYGNFSFCSSTINLKFRLGAYAAGTSTFAGYITEGTGTATYIMNMVKQ